MASRQVIKGYLDRLGALAAQTQALIAAIELELEANPKQQPVVNRDRPIPAFRTQVPVEAPVDPAQLEREQRAARLIERYGELYKQHRNGASPRPMPSKDFPLAMAMVDKWSDEQLDELMELVLTTDDDWIGQTDRSFRIFETKSSWADDRLRAYRAQKARGNR